MSLHIHTLTCMHIRKRTGKRVLNEIGKHDILFLLHFNLLSKQQPVCIIKVIFFTRIFSLRFWHSLFKWNFKCITTYRMQNALAMLRLRVYVCVFLCVYLYFDFTEFRGRLPRLWALTTPWYVLSRPAFICI